MRGRRRVGRTAPPQRLRAEGRLTLLAAGTAARRRSRKAETQALLSDLDWLELAENLRRRRLLASLGPRIVELAEGQAGEEFSAAVEQSLEAGRRQGTFLALVSERATAALAEAGIRSVPQKGPLLSESIYGDPGRRLSNDVDLLVAPEDLRSAVDVVRSLGYRAPADPTGRDGLPQLHFALVHESEELPPIELHWRIHWYERNFARERLLPPDLDRLASWAPAAADELAALLLFYARDGFIDLRMAVDIGAWWDAFGDALSAGALDDVTRNYPHLQRAISVAATVADRTVGLPAAQLFAKAPKAGLRDRIARRLAAPNPRGSEPQLHAEMGLVDGLLMPPGDFRAFARRQILLPSHEARDKLNGNGNGWGSRLRYDARVLVRCGVLGRYALAVAKTFTPAARGA